MRRPDGDALQPLVGWIATSPSKAAMPQEGLVVDHLEEHDLFATALVANGVRTRAREQSAHLKNVTGSHPLGVQPQALHACSDQHAVHICPKGSLGREGFGGALIENVRYENRILVQLLDGPWQKSHRWPCWPPGSAPPQRHPIALARLEDVRQFGEHGFALIGLLG